VANDAGPTPEEQQRELDEIRRSFQEIGIRLGSLFEPAKPDDPTPQQPSPPPVAEPPRQGPTWRLVLVLAALAVLLGGGVGYLLHRPATALAASPAATSVVTRTVTVPKVKVVAPASCRKTAELGDQLVDLYTRNIRDRRLSLALKAYTLASQACRKEASP
jgi:hypothetical protein